MHAYHSILHATNCKSIWTLFSLLALRSFPLTAHIILHHFLRKLRWHSRFYEYWVVACLPQHLCLYWKNGWLHWSNECSHEVRHCFQIAVFLVHRELFVYLKRERPGWSPLHQTQVWTHMCQHISTGLLTNPDAVWSICSISSLYILVLRKRQVLDVCTKSNQWDLGHQWACRVEYVKRIVGVLNDTEGLSAHVQTEEAALA